MSSLIYIAVVIVIAIFSNVNKAGKNRPGKSPRGGMPTFGGDGSPLRRTRPAGDERPSREGSGFPVPGGGSSLPSPSPSPSSYEEPEYDTSPVWKEPALTPSPDYETGEGLSMEQAGEDSVRARTERMQLELERIQAKFDGMGGAAGAGFAEIPDREGAPSASNTAVRRGVQDSRQALQNGVVWAEILGPPRSRNPHSTRKRA